MFRVSAPGSLSRDPKRNTCSLASISLWPEENSSTIKVLTAAHTFIMGSAEQS